MKPYQAKTLNISTYFCDEIVVEGHYSEGIKGDRNQPDDPNEFEISTIYENIDGDLRETDKFDEDYILQTCLEMCEADMSETTLNEKHSENIMNTQKYLSCEEKDLFEFLLLSEFGRAGNSLEKKKMIYEIARKCELIGLDKEFINELKL